MYGRPPAQRSCRRLALGERRSRPSIRIAPPPTRRRPAVAEQRHPDASSCPIPTRQRGRAPRRRSIPSPISSTMSMLGRSSMPQTSGPRRRRTPRGRRSRCGAHDSLPGRGRSRRARSPSVTRLVPTVSRPMASTGSKHPPGLNGDRQAVLVDHQPPVGVRRLDAEAEEAERRRRAHRIGQPQPDLDQQRARHVRQQLTEHDPRALLADGLGGLDEVALDHLLRSPTHHPSHSRRVRERRPPTTSSQASARSPRPAAARTDLREG